MNSKICNDSDPKFKQRWQDVFDTANRYAADYILQGEDEVVTGPHGNDIPSREVRIDAMATAVADFDTIRVLHNVRIDCYGCGLRIFGAPGDPR